MTKRCPASPGPIEPSESIARGIYSPDVFDRDTGKVTPAAVKMDELLSIGGVTFDCGNSSGVSVFRLDHSGGREQASATVKEIVNRPRRDGAPRQAIGYAQLIAHEIINIEHGPLDLLDDGSAELSCHAVVRAPNGRTKASMREARDKLVKMMNDNLVLFPKEPAEDDSNQE